MAAQRRYRPVYRSHDSRPPERLRHLRKYAEGNLGPQSFFFRGLGAKMNLRAQNLTAFCELAAGVDDDTWLFHLRTGDYSAWMRGVIKDDDLAREVVAGRGRFSSGLRPRVAAWSATPSTGATCFQPEAPGRRQTEHSWRDHTSLTSRR